MEFVDELKIFDNNLINKLNNLASNKIEYWDIRSSISTGINLDFTNSKSREVSSYKISECGIRAFINGGFSFTVIKDLSKNSIEKGFKTAIKLAQLTGSLSKNKFSIKERDPLIKTFKINSQYKIDDVNIEEKIDLVKYHEKISSTYSSAIKNTRTFYMDGHSNNIFINSFGSYISQDLSVLRIFTLAYAQKNGILQRAVNSVGGIGGFEISKTEKASGLSEKTAKEAVELLDAKSPVGGKFTIIMDPKLTGTFIHEALGHAAEADTVLNKESILEGKIGEKVAIEDITICDDPTMGQGKKLNLPYELFGSYFIDDEGIPSQKTVIIQDGILVNYLHCLETSSRMNLAPNGHGRASSCTARPQVRMGITTLEPKDWDVEEMIKDTKNGILCKDFQYGYSDPTTGNFQFKCKLSYKIENGEIKELMRDVALSGMTLEVLNKISAIGNKDTFSFSDGMCGKGGQGVRVCDGGPYIRAEDITVGGLG